jgi:hypothetical protein
LVGVIPRGAVLGQSPTLAIHDIQGRGLRSPLEGQLVATSGVVTARRTNGFFIQTPPGADDGDARTSQGLLVFTGAAPPAAVVPGALVRVSGRVVEFVPAADPRSPPLTEIAESPLVEVVGFGTSLPPPVEITAALASSSITHDALEPLEGMRVRVASMAVVAPTLGSVTEATAVAVSNGVFYGVVAGVPRPFREPGVDARNGLPPEAPCCVPLFDGNPERLRVDSDGQPGAPPLDVPTGAVLADVVGPLDYAFRTYTILPDVATPPRVISLPAEAGAVRLPAPGQWTIGTVNVQRLFDTRDDPGVGDVVLTALAFQTRVARLTRYVREVMRSPDIVAVQEVENLATLQTLADVLNQVNGGAGASTNYDAYLEPGNDPGGINVGVLVNRVRVRVVDVAQVGAATLFRNPATGRLETVNDRPPLVVVVRGPGQLGRRPPLTLVVNHLRSLTDIESPTDGARVRAKRAAQAEFLAELVQQRQRANPFERLLVVGDLNAFGVNDGLVDVVGTIRGAPTPATHVVRASSDLVEPNLVDLLGLLPAQERYSYVFDGTAQVLDHALASAALMPDIAGAAYARGNADAPEVWRNDPRRVGRASDHDGLVVYVRPGSR